MTTLMTTLRVLVAFTAALLLGPVDAHAGARAQCKRSCGPAVASCAAASPLRPAKALRRCRRDMLRACLRQGQTACALPPTTTSTTLGLATTTTTTTSTTLPTAPAFWTDVWTFSGSLAEDTCGSSGGLSDTFAITQRGTQVTATIGSIPGLTLTGELTADGIELVGAYADDGCTVEIALVARNDGTVVVTAGAGFDVTCGFTSCRSIWVGTLRR